MKSKKSLIFQTSPDELPVSHIRWKSQNRLLASNVEGYLIEFDIQESKRPVYADIKIASVKEEENQILAMDYSSDVLKVCTAGKDCNIRLYDDISKRLVRTYEKGNWFSPGHSNRVFSVKFKPDNPNMLITGGWDGAVFLWDIRESKNVAAFCGPNVSGDTIDCRDNTILIGSHRSKDPLELWDFKTCKKICTVDVDADPKVQAANAGRQRLHLCMSV
jgi:COMPASS component SWD3